MDHTVMSQALNQEIGLFARQQMSCMNSLITFTAAWTITLATLDAPSQKEAPSIVFLEGVDQCDDVEDRKDNTKPVNKLPTSSTVVNNRVEENLEEDSKDNCDIPDSDEEILNCVMSTFRNILQESTSKSERPLKEIDRRINLMGKAWKSDLSKEVKHMMYKMAKDLSTGNIDSAEKLHCAIMVQNVREVKNWMVGVKHIIEMKRENQNLLNS
ncbi:hypothetical protein TNCV_1209841 [Trichonephila clavipes]|nr:hypothetical protein TNCV_1209841 [Trichonephila clavipes]